MWFMYEEENTGVYMWSSDHRKREKRGEGHGRDHCEACFLVLEWKENNVSKSQSYFVYVQQSVSASACIDEQVKQCCAMSLFLFFIV